METAKPLIDRLQDEKLHKISSGIYDFMMATSELAGSLCSRNV